jgi:hypothetical protein
MFVSNIVMGILFVFSQFDLYVYAAITAFVAAMILLVVELKTHVKQRPPHPTLPAKPPSL